MGQRLSARAFDATLPNLRFLQVDLDQEQRSTYQFVPGVAETSLAAHTAKRLGVIFEELSELVDEQGGES
jgi:hypothetical protein